MNAKMATQNDIDSIFAMKSEIWVSLILLDDYSQIAIHFSPLIIISLGHAQPGRYISW